MKWFLRRYHIALQTLLMFVLAVITGVYVNMFTHNLITSQKKLVEVFQLMQWWNLLLITAVFIVYFQYRLGKLPLEKMTSIRNALIPSILEAACTTLIYPSKTKHIRAIITLREGTSGIRKTKYFYNATADPERVASYPLDFGVTGQAYENRCVVAEELPEDHISSYALDVQKAVLPQIRSILAAPLFDPNNPSEEPLGVLAFDSIHELATIKFDKLEIRSLAQKWADIISQILTSTEG